jgi:hypothetical protein
MPPFSAPILNDCHFSLIEHATLSVCRDEIIPVLTIKYNVFKIVADFQEKDDEDNI